MAIQQLDLFGNIITTPPPKQKEVVVEKPVAEVKVDNAVVKNIEQPITDTEVETTITETVEQTTNPESEITIVEIIDPPTITTAEIEIPVIEVKVETMPKPAEKLRQKPTIIEIDEPEIITVYQDIIKRKRGRPRKEQPLIPIVKVKQKRGRKSFAEIATNVDLIDIPNDEELNKKQYYSISIVAKWFNVNNSQIRLWENQFDILQPKKNKKGDRLFRPEDIRNLKVIYHLLRQRKFSVEGAKDYLIANQHKTPIDVQMRESLQNIKSFLLELKANL